MLRDEVKVREAMVLLDKGLDAHAQIPMGAWAKQFVNSQSKGKWQELQLVATLIGLTSAYVVHGEDLPDLVEHRLNHLAEASAMWKRPTKTQSKEQWMFIASVVSGLLHVLGSSPEEADGRLRDQFGASGLKELPRTVREVGAGPGRNRPDSTHVWLPGPDADDGWWSRYERALKLRMIGDTSLSVINDDASFIVDKAVLGPADGSDWPQSRERRGAVMGAVQSGKTASMLAVIAKSIDAGVDAVVVLAGTRTALWLQTWERLGGQLDTFPIGLSGG